MRILVWNALWPSQGNPVFFVNCFEKHLVRQANTLVSMGHAVDVVLPEQLRGGASLMHSGIRVIEFGISEVLVALGGFRDPSRELYTIPDCSLSGQCVDLLKGRLADRYDVILLWETPVPFLERLFPEAVIVHQMPGAFSRAPYPHTVVFDPAGLYRRGLLYRDASKIVSASPNGIGRDFSDKLRAAITRCSPPSLKDILTTHDHASLTLAPLQISSHYSYAAETGYASQIEFLVDVLSTRGEREGVVSTQYVTRHASDAPLSDDTVAFLRARWPNLIFSREFDRIGSVSQYILPYVDKIATCNSSLGLQAFAWGLDVEVFGNTFLAPFSSDAIAKTTTSVAVGQEATLDFILQRHQPLADMIMRDGRFITSLLEELIAIKKAGKPLDANSIPAFSDIDPQYFDKLLRAFREKEVLKSPGLGNVEVAKFANLCMDPSIKVVSIDVFDTLLNRPIETPVDIYALIEAEAVKRHGTRFEGFARFRVAAEHGAREAMGEIEITLADIYDVLSRQWQLTKVSREIICALELEIERRLSAVRPQGRALFDAAVKSGRPVILVSDMYHSNEFIKTLLDDAGIKGYIKLYVSSSCGVTKKGGGLFDLVLTDLALAPHELLHVGDNKIGDDAVPAAKGIKTHRILRAVDRMRGNPLLKACFHPHDGAGQISRSVIAGTLAAGLFDEPVGQREKDSLFADSPFRLGFAALGPLAVGFCSWLHNTASSRDVSRLYFLSREGKLLRQIYQTLYGDAAIAHDYLFASRRATRVAGLKSRDDVSAVATQPFQSGVTLAALVEGRFGLEFLDVFGEVAQAHGFTDADAALDATQSCRTRFAQLCMSLADHILAKAADERTAYMSYLGQMGLGNERRPGVVDVGWKANIQGALGSLAFRSLDGFYFATLQGAERWRYSGHRLHSYIAEFAAVPHEAPILRNRHIIEFLFCSSDRSLLHIRQNGASFEPVMRTERGHAARRLFIDEAHRGAVAFASTLRKRFGPHLDAVCIDARYASRILDSYLTDPTPHDARLLADATFQDEFGGVSAKQLIANDRSSSIWMAGFDSLKEADKVSRQKKEKDKSLVKAIVSPPRSASLLLDQKQDSNSPFVLLVEKFFVSRLSSPKKREKYKRDRKAFFLDSKSRLMRRWYDLVAKGD